MYEALRTPACKLIANHFRLASIQFVTIKITNRNGGIFYNIDVDGKSLDYYRIQELIKADGFPSGAEFIHYWLDGKDHIHYDLDLYHWTDLRF